MESKRKRIIGNERANIVHSEIGKLPPQAVDLEEAVLGAVMIEEDAYHAVADMLHPDIFYKEQNARVCAAVLAIKHRGEPVDILTIIQELKKTGELELVGGAYYVSKLTDRIASSANIEMHARIVQQQYIKREAIRSSTELIRDAYEDGADPFEVLDTYEKNLTALTGKLFVTRISDSARLYSKLIAQNEILTSSPSAIIGVPSGFTDLDRITGGWRGGNLIILAARPGMGKTALAIQAAKFAAVYANKPAAIFSLEMSELELYHRLSSQETEIPLDQFTTSGLDASTLKRFEMDSERLRSAPLYVDDTAGMTIFDLRTKARKLKREKKIELLVIDYLQLMSGGDKPGNREQEVSAISRGLKVLAKELDIPIIALAQLSRQTENRPGGEKLPQLSDLRDSGSIEQDADLVMFLYRPEYYGITHDTDNNSTKGKAMVIIAKNRGGALRNTVLKWKGECVMFKNYGDPEYVPLKPIATNDDFIQSTKGAEPQDTKDLPF